jgi:hypothetical protein
VTIKVADNYNCHMETMSSEPPDNPPQGFWDQFMRPVEPAWTDPTDEQVAALRDQLMDAAAELAGGISPRMRQLSADQATHSRYREQALLTSDWQLAMLRALREVGHVAEELADGFARSAGAAGANYPQMGAAWGISRQAARKRWLGAVSAISEDANKEPVHFQAFGGEARIAFHPEDGGWWWIATAANGAHQDAGEETTYDTSEEASAAAGAFLAANTTTKEPTA